jgi:hypothetical protein
MSDSQPLPVSTPAAPPPLTMESLLEAHNALRSSLHVTLVMLFILSGSLFVFFLREVSLARRQTIELRQVVADYEKNAYPMMESFRIKLQAFAQTHPDFNPIYARYFGTTNASAAGPSSAKSPPSSNVSPARLPPPIGR